MFSGETEQKEKPERSVSKQEFNLCRVMICYHCKQINSKWILYYFWWRRWKLLCVIQQSLCSFEPALNEPGCEWIPYELHKSKGISTHHSTITISMSWLRTNRLTQKETICYKSNPQRAKQAFVAALLLQRTNCHVKATFYADSF